MSNDQEPLWSFPAPSADAVRVNFIVDDELGVIAHAVAVDGRETTAAASVR